MEEIENAKFPVKPTEPLDSECCGTGCTPCVFDIYKKQLRKWGEECNRIRDNEAPSETEAETETGLEGSTFHDQLTPEKYLHFKLLDIIPDTSTSNIYRFDASPSSPSPSPSSPTQEEDESLSSPVINSRHPHRHLRRPSRPPPIELGQHVVIKIGNQAKQYTVLDVNKLCDSDDNSNNYYFYFDILIKIYSKGSLTPLINTLKVGDEVSIRGPFGKVVKLGVNTFKNIVILAAGTGIAPMYRLIESIIRNEEDDTRIKLIYSNRSVNNILLKSKLQEWSSFWNFNVSYFLSRNGGQDNNISYGMKNYVRLRRFVKADFIKECQGLIGQENSQNGKSSSRFFVCGTKSFEKDMINYMSQCGLNDCDYHVF